MLPALRGHWDTRSSLLGRATAEAQRGKGRENRSAFQNRTERFHGDCWRLFPVTLAIPL